MKTKETLATKLLKRFYGVQGVLDEYRRNEIYKIGNAGFIAMFYYALFSNFIVLLVFSLDNHRHTEDILMWYIIANMIFLICGICGYVLITTRRRHLLENEVQDIETQKKHLKYLVIRQGIFFGVFSNILNTFMSSGFSDFFSVRSMFGACFAGAMFGSLMYLFQRMNLKKVQ
ncbi:DUF3278 domain-containing protein [Leuconostoc citreum]|uniref:DUF3278 domain-containing protein n=1 Tax=Leuconostoc citreum TaxID=33964 RepID=UPI001C1F6767|nr:DUF3278 domain-containing protein [Leuconostoc citreum]MBU7450200.1 DUF3278 domain-containing protein [Leuconostoc citreum]